MAFDLGGFTNPLATQAIEPDITEATPGEVLGATAGETFDSLPAVSILRQQQRYNEAGPETPWGGAVDPRNAGSDVDAMAAERGDAPVRTTIQPDEANKQAKAAGAQGLTFDTPIADTTAKSIIDQHVLDQQRASVIARNGNSILSGQVARFATSALVGLADPINDAAMLIPAAPEAFVGAKLAAASNVFERTLIRGAAGAANGAAGMAALEPLNYEMSQADYNDYSAGDALRNIFMGAAMGAAGHMVLGGMFGREHLDDPGTALDATRAAIGQTLNDQPVDVADLINHAEATQAADRLEGWHGEQQRILADADANTFQGPTVPDRGDAIAAHENTLGQLREQASQMRGEIDDARQQAIVNGMDPETSARLDQVNQELGGVIPSARRAALEQERTMLTEGRGTLDVDGGDPLEQARTASQVQGLSAAADRTEAQAADVESKLATLRQQQADEEAAAQAARISSDRSTRIQQAKIDSRESVLQNLMERDVRVYAARIGAQLEPGEATVIAKEIRTAQPAEAKDIIANHLNALAQRGGKGDVISSTRAPVASATEGLRAEAQQSAQDMARRAMNPQPDPQIVQADRTNKAVIDSAPKVTGAVDKNVAEATKLVQEAHQNLQREIASGRVVETQEMRDAMMEADHTENVGKAASDYAACLVGRGF